MAELNALAGNKFRVKRSNGGAPETFEFFCMATTRELEQEKELEKYPSLDCADPEKLAVEKSVVKMTRWGGTLSGMLASEKLSQLRADFASQDAVRYMFEVAGTGAAGGGAWTGALHITKLTVGSQENGIVKFTATITGSGDLVWTAAT